MRIATVVKYSGPAAGASTGWVVTGNPAILCGVLIGTDATEDPTVTIYNSTDNSGVEVMPTQEFDASALGLNGFTPGYGKSCPLGIYAEISNCSGTCEITIDYIDSES